MKYQKTIKYNNHAPIFFLFLISPLDLDNEMRDRNFLLLSIIHIFFIIELLRQNEKKIVNKEKHLREDHANRIQIYS